MYVEVQNAFIFSRFRNDQSDSCLFGFSVMCFVLSRQKRYVDMVVCISYMHSCLCVCVDVMVLSSG